MVVRSLDDLKQLREEGLRSLFPARTRVAVGMATCGRAAGAAAVFDAIQEEVKGGTCLW